MVAGTRTIRTTVASSAIAVAIPSPSIFTVTSTSLAKPRNTATMIAAAAEITRPVDDSPLTTLSRASPLSSQCSRTRESRNTS